MAKDLITGEWILEVTEAAAEAAVASAIASLEEATDGVKYRSPEAFFPMLLALALSRAAKGAQEVATASLPDTLREGWEWVEF